MVNKSAKNIRSLVREVQNQVGINVGKFDISKFEFIKKGSIEVTKRVLLEKVGALDEYARLSADTRRAFESLSKAQLIELLSKIDFEAILLKGCLLVDYVKKTVDKIAFSVLLEFVLENASDEVLAVANTDKKCVLSSDLIKDLERFDLSVDFHKCLNEILDDCQESFFDKHGYNGIIDYSTPDGFSEPKVKGWIKRVLWSYGGLDREFLFSHHFKLRIDSDVLSEFVDKHIPKYIYDSAHDILLYYYMDWYEVADNTDRLKFLQTLKESKRLSPCIYNPLEYLGLGDKDLYNAIVNNDLSYEVVNLGGNWHKDLERLDLKDEYRDALDSEVLALINKAQERVGFEGWRDGGYAYSWVLDTYNPHQIKTFLTDMAKKNHASDALLALIDGLSDNRVSDFLKSNELAVDYDYLHNLLDDRIVKAYSRMSRDDKFDELGFLADQGTIMSLLSLDDLCSYFDFVYESFKRYASSEYSIEG